MREYRHRVKEMLLLVWAWICEVWEFLVLLTCGFHPARKLFKCRSDSEDTCEAIFTCLDMYRNGNTATAQLCDLLNPCDPYSITELTTDEGYNLLQLAVSRNDIDFTTYLLAVKRCNPNIAKCSLPLHIAIKTGSARMVTLLLQYKAKPYIQSGMCYPEPHVPSYDSHSKFFFVNRSMVCGGVAKDAYQQALDLDSVEMLNNLMTQKLSCRRKGVSFAFQLLLHYGCSVGAFQCIRHLVEHWSCNVNAVDNRGCTPLMYAVTGHMAVIDYLVKKGADITPTSYQSQTIMHRLYATTEPVEDVYKKTKLFLALGADAVVNSFDVFQNTPFHYLIMKFCQKLCTEEESELRECIRLLLHHNSDPLIPDNNSYLPLRHIFEGFGELNQHKSEKLCSVLKIFCQSCPLSIQTAIDEAKWNSIFYITDLTLKTGCLEYMSTVKLLQQYGADINHIATSPSELCLKETGAQVSRLSLVALLSKQARAELNLISEVPDSSLTLYESFKVKPVMIKLFEQGLNPNRTCDESRTVDQCQSVNPLLAFVQLIHECQTSIQLRLVHDWIQTILQWGGNPDIEAYKPELSICTSQSSIFLRKNSTLPVRFCVQDSTEQLWLCSQDTMEDILLLFINTMSHDSLAEYFANVHTSLPPNSPSIKMLTHFLNKPLTLKQLARVVIYKSVNRKISCHVNDLSLPPTLKTYLLSMK